ncbi:MAG: hypothetical protein RLZ98_271 [Pseudomonadota bacterium]
MTVFTPEKQVSDNTVTTSEAAPGVQRIDVTAVQSAAQRQFYAERQKIYPKLASGRFRSIKWLIMIVTLGIYYGLPWLRWDRGEHLPSQAVLLDFPNQRLFFGPIEIWAQELYLITGVLVISALSLFLVTSIAGRVWCGYTCPQTVWTDLMIMIERFWQGDRNARMRLDKSGWTLEKVFRKFATHVSWLLVSLATGGVFVFYFRDAPTLAGEFVTGTAPAIAYLFLGIFTFSTYLLGGLAREQVCIYMCPWPRIQGAMFDRDSLLISYRAARGEPRGSHKKGESWDDRGDCVDCKACVAVCPMGIDIRDGPQLECIQCALCIDACNDIMTKVDRPQGLIAYETFRNLEASEQGERVPIRFLRARTFWYLGLISLAGLLTLFGLLARQTLDVNVLPDRNPLFVRLSDGSVRNGFTIKILNKEHEARRFTISISDLPGASLRLVGYEGDARPLVEVGTDNVRPLRAYVTLPRSSLAARGPISKPFRLVVTDTSSGKVLERALTFKGPAQ